MKGRKPNLKQTGKAFRKVKSPPKWMDDDAAGEWRRVFPSLTERRILTESDLGSLEMYCMAVATARQMERKLRVEGYTYTDMNGNLKRNPAAAIMSDAMNRARLFATEIGLTPFSRSRPEAMEDDDEDSLVD